jgi:hypothetical protein
MRKNLKAFLLILLFVYFANVLGIETDLTVKLDKSEVKPGEIVTLDLVARNPLKKSVAGGLTVSFSSEVELVKKDEESRLYPIGATVYCVKNHQCATTNMMVENWYEGWPNAHENTMHLRLKATKTGPLKIYARAAFMKNRNQKEIINIPHDSSVSDQQGYSVHVSSVFVKNNSTIGILQTNQHQSNEKNKLNDDQRNQANGEKKSSENKDNEIDNEIVERFIEDHLEAPVEKISGSVEVRLPMTGMMAYKYADPFNQEEFSDNIPFIGVGGTVNLINLPILNNISLDLYGQWSDKARDGFFSRTVDEGMEELENVNSAFNRDDYAITVGWQIPPQILPKLPKSWPKFMHKLWHQKFSVFLGYKSSKTDAHVITIKDIEDSKMMDVTRSESHFKTYGRFYGVGYTYAVDNQNKLGFYVAGGRLKGKYDFTAFVGEQAFPNEQTINSTWAWRAGLSLNGLLTRLSVGKLTYGISLDGYYYTMDMGITERDLGSVVPRTFVEERVLSLKASLNWVYDL